MARFRDGALYKTSPLTERGLLDHLEDLAGDIQEYSQNQKNLWRKIPHLALEADGRGGYSDHYGTTYRTGYWRLESRANNGCYHLAIDLLTGTIVQFLHPKQRSADTNDILTYLASRHGIEELNASTIISDLEKHIKDFEKDNTPEVRAWRETIRKEFGVEKIYTKRKNKLKIDWGADL